MESRGRYAALHHGTVRFDASNCVNAFESMARVHYRRTGTHIDGHSERLAHLIFCRAMFHRSLDVKCDTVVTPHCDCDTKCD